MTQKTILLIDHSETMSNAKRLAMAGGPHLAITALSIHEGVEILRERAVDLIVVDTDLAALEAHSAGQSLRVPENGRVVPILYFTGGVESAAAEGKAEAAAVSEYDFFLPKTFTYTEFLTMLDRHAGGPAATTADPSITRSAE